MPRGGYQKPTQPAGASAPGAGSRRTDGGVQPIREADMDSPDLQYGDRQNLNQAQRIARVANRPSEGGPARRPGGSPGVTGKKLPPWLTSGESMFPQEPGSAGLDMGAGPGSEALMASQPAPDEREEILQGLVSLYGSPQARAMLNEMRNTRATAMQAETELADTQGALADPLAEPTELPPAGEGDVPPEEEIPFPESDMPTTEEEIPAGNAVPE